MSLWLLQIWCNFCINCSYTGFLATKINNLYYVIKSRLFYNYLHQPPKPTEKVVVGHLEKRRHHLHEPSDFSCRIPLLRSMRKMFSKCVQRARQKSGWRQISLVEDVTPKREHWMVSSSFIICKLLPQKRCSLKSAIWGSAQARNSRPRALSLIYIVRTSCVYIYPKCSTITKKNVFVMQITPKQTRSIISIVISYISILWSENKVCCVRVLIVHKMLVFLRCV